MPLSCNYCMLIYLIFSPDKYFNAFDLEIVMLAAFNPEPLFFPLVTASAPALPRQTLYSICAYSQGKKRRPAKDVVRKSKRCCSQRTKASVGLLRNIVHAAA